MPQEGTSSYPAGLDDFNVPSNPETTPLGSAGDADRDHPTLLADMGAAIEAVQGELGLDPAGASATVKARLDTHDANTDAHHAKSHAHSGADGSGTVAHSATTGRTANDHHNQQHSISGSDHTGTLAHSALSSVTADQHHAQSHAHNGADSSGTVSHSNLTGVTADQHHSQQHSISGSDHTGTLAHSALSSVTADQHHAQSHSNADHSDRFTSANVTEVGTGAATAETNLQTATLTANSLGTGGVLRVEAWGTMSGAVGNRTVRLYFGATAIATFTQTAVTGAAVDWHVEATIAADGATNAQKVAVRILSGDSAVEQVDVTTAAIDTTANVTIKTTGQTSDASDEISSEALIVWRVV